MSELSTANLLPHSPAHFSVAPSTPPPGEKVRNVKRRNTGSNLARNTLKKKIDRETFIKSVLKTKVSLEK